MGAHLATVDGIRVRIFSLMNAWPDLHSTGIPPSDCTMSTVFQVSRGSCTIVRARVTLQERRRQQPTM